MRLSRLAILICTLFIFSSSLLAGRLDQQLESKLSGVNPEEQISVLIKMADQVDMKSLKAELKARNSKLPERHKLVIESLKLKAKNSQKDIVGYLSAAKNRGQLKDFKQFWIANLIWVQAPSSEIQKLALRPDVETISLTPKVELVTPVEMKAIDYQAQPAAGIENGLKAIKAPQVWGMGFRGKGRLVCNIDTGVNRLHSALVSRWRGNFLPVEKRKEAWFDPVYGTTLPNDAKAVVTGHGTFTMGIMTGINSTSGDTIGVAPEALWIAAQAIDLGVEWPVEIAALQWASDPDDDPNTLDDVPDVVNNSWGIAKYNTGAGCALIPSFVDCWELYWQVLDNVAAAGPVVVFAAGNEGTCNGGVSNLRNPADRINSEFNVFSVGSVDGNNPTYPVSYFSSRGPSDCDGITKKPEVVAPGENVRSSYLSSYTTGSGTSFSAPHVAGAAALLKQVNPNATSDQILRALFVSAKDLGLVGEDNSYGRGLINVLAAIDSLPPLVSPHIFVSEYKFIGDSNNAPDPGEQLTFSPTLINNGLNATSVQLRLSSVSPLVTVIDSVSDFGDIPTDDTVLQSLDLTQFSVSSSAQPGEKLYFTLKITAAGGYTITYPLLFYVTAKPLQSKANHDSGNFIFTISNFGQYGFASGSFNEGIGGDTGVGFKYPKAGINNLYEGAVLFGLPTGQVSDAARDFSSFLMSDSDFSVGPGGELVLDNTSTNRKSAQDGFAIFTDENAENPIGLKVVQRSYVFSDTANDDYVILEYTIHNQSGSELTGLRAGFFTDFDFPWLSGASDRAGFVRSKEMGYMYQSNNTGFRGIVITDTLGIKSFRAIENIAAVNGIYDGFTETEKWLFMSEGFEDTLNTTNTDGSILAATGPWDIPAGDSIKTSLAIVGASSLANLQTYGQRAIDKYRTELMCTAIPGDANASNTYTLGDAVAIVNYTYGKAGCSPWPTCWLSNLLCRGDWNGSGTVTLGDAIRAVNYIYNKPGGPWNAIPIGVCCQSP